MAKQQDSPTFISVAEAARLAGVSRTAVYYALNDGRLRGQRIGRAWAILEQDLLAWEPRDYPRAVSLYLSR